MAVRIVGVDCATEASEVGLAAGRFQDGQLTLDHVERGSGDGSLARAFASRIREVLGDASSAVLALDAPLGWPAPMAQALDGHRAGARFGTDGHPSRYFHRTTDDVVRARTNKIPLEVGANFIARTAFVALELIHVLRERPEQLPLLWEPKVPSAPGIIEVYPAATLLARGLSPKGYKSRKLEERAPARKRIIEALRSEIEIDAAQERQMLGSDHVLDAVLCCLGAGDFLQGAVVAPTPAHVDAARTEGWIWFRAPAAPLADDGDGIQSETSR